jgi:mRNA-degrading endonuclease HigB of HigAB toxin-antitoxin module
MVVTPNQSYQLFIKLTIGFEKIYIRVTFLDKEYDSI